MRVCLYGANKTKSLNISSPRTIKDNTQLPYVIVADNAFSILAGVFKLFIADSN